MRYLIREAFTCQRGKVPEFMEDMKVVVDLFKSMGIADQKVYVDISGRMDTVYHQYEVDSLDGYFTGERSLFVDMDEPTKRLVDHFNNITVAGSREIFEILV